MRIYNWTPEKEKEILEFIKSEFEKQQIFSGEQVYQDDYLSGQGALEFLGDLADIVEPIVKEKDE